MAGKTKGIDYSKWSNIELSDDEEVHPNIDADSFRRWRKRQKEELAEQDRLQEIEYQKGQEERAKNKARAAEIEAALAAAPPPDATTLREEAATLTAKEEEFAKAEADHEVKEAIKKKNFKWNADNMCHVKYEKTAVNDRPDCVPDPKKDVDYTQRKVDESTGKIMDVGGALVERFSEVPMDNMKEIERYVLTHPELLAKKNSDDLAILCFRALQEKKKKKALNYLQHSFIIRYCQEIGPSGVMQFFKRMYTEQGRAVFEEDVQKTLATMKQTAEEPEPARPPPKEEEEEMVPVSPELQAVLESLPESVTEALIAGDNEKFRAAMEVLPPDEAQAIMGKLVDAGIVQRKGGSGSDAAGPPPPAAASDSA